MKKTIFLLLSGMCVLLTLSLLSCAAKNVEPADDTEPSETHSSTETASQTTDDKIEEEAYFVTSLIDRLRDPFVLVHNGRYYIYGTGWKAYKCTKDDLSRHWSMIIDAVTKPDDAQKDLWAPEVFYYKDAFYMFTTYYSSKTNHRGCAIFKADRPEGPFVLYSDGHVTPSDWDAIDGTLYIDSDGQPWMVFVHEWTSMPDSVGAMAAARLSDDLSHFISEPIQLFCATDAPWARSGVTDGCFMYTCSNGELVMLWSSFSADGYCVGVARSDNGALDGKWTHDPTPLYSKEIHGIYDGGHPMLFCALNGQMYMAIHSPNTATDDRKEKPVFIPFYEKDGVLSLDLTQK